MKHYYDTFTTLLGDFSVALDETGAVVATALGGAAELGKRFKRGTLLRRPKQAATVRRQVTEFLTGRRRSFAVKLAPSGTEFQKRVWSALGRIPFGETRSYAQIAAELGNRGSARAVGRANAANPICVLVPCHRVVGADGSLTGFAFGTEAKQRLLELERGHPRRARYSQG